MTQTPPPYRDEPDDIVIQMLCLRNDELQAEKEELAAQLDRAEEKLQEAKARKKGMAMVPREITAESGHKAGMIGDFAVTAEDCCYACEGLGNDDNDDECDVCQGRGEVRRLIGIPWPVIKEIHKRIVEIAEGGDA